MFLSVIICTYNRSDSLLKTLHSIQCMSFSEHVSWELLIVDNNSNDNTKDVIDGFICSTTVNARYVFESKQGLSHARNKGVIEAKGKVIAFTDDDVIVERDWLDNIAKLFRDGSVACAGGPIFPIWEGEPPGWLTEDLYPYIALLDLGGKVLELSRPTIWGANLIIRADVLSKCGAFDVNLGRNGDKLYSTEETRIIEDVIRLKLKVVYSPFIIVHHMIPKKRMVKSYYAKWQRDSGELAALTEVSSGKNKTLLVCYRVATLVVEIVKYLHGCIFNGLGFKDKLVLYWQIGFVAGTVKK